MYGKCGQLNVCKDIFNEIRSKDYKKYSTEIKLWNAMIHAYGEMEISLMQ